MFKAAGCYDNLSAFKLINVNTRGYYRTADFYTESNPYFLWFRDNEVRKLNNTGRGYGNSVCPVKE